MILSNTLKITFSRIVKTNMDSIFNIAFEYLDFLTLEFMSSKLWIENPISQKKSIQKKLGSLWDFF